MQAPGTCARNQLSFPKDRPESRHKHGSSRTTFLG